MEEIQTGSFGSRNPLKVNYNKIAKLALAVAVIIAAVATSAYFIQTSKYTPPKLKYYMPANLSSNQKALYLANNNQYQEAVQVYVKELAHTNNTSDKLNIYGYMEALAIRFKDYNSAQLYANDAKSIDSKSPAPYVYLAELASAEGNKNAAKQYWQQAINYLDPNQLGYNMIKADYQRNIARLQ